MRAAHRAARAKRQRYLAALLRACSGGIGGTPDYLQHRRAEDRSGGETAASVWRCLCTRRINELKKDANSTVALSLAPHERAASHAEKASNAVRQRNSVPAACLPLKTVAASSVFYAASVR